MQTGVGMIKETMCTPGPMPMPLMEVAVLLYYQVERHPLKKNERRKEGKLFVFVLLYHVLKHRAS